MHTMMALALAAGILQPASARPLLLTKARVSLDPSLPPTEGSLLMKDGRIAFVGEEAEARKRGSDVQATVIELGGAVIYPGWTDAHGHLLGLGEARENLDLRGKSKDQILRLVAERAAHSAPGAWVKGRGWDQNLWTGGAFPTSRELSARSPKNPVVLGRVDGHAIWVNELAMRAAGVDGKTVDPAGGRLLRDASGQPNGVFVDNAEFLIEKVIPLSTAPERARAFEEAFSACTRVGLTGVGDPSAYDHLSIGVLRDLARTGRMKLRVYATVNGNDPRLEDFLRAPRIEEGRLTVRAVKIYADGALGSRGAALLSDYADEPGNRGLVLTPPETLEKLAERCFRAGWQLWIHAIGDRGNRLALEAYEKAMALVHPVDARPRIEHAQVIALEDLPRWKALGVIASVQPTHATSDRGWAEQRLGPARLAGAYAWRKFLQAG
ncbi:MAG: amidohydrolase, partial [Thermoanaerobaculia bacterium]